MYLVDLTSVSILWGPRRSLLPRDQRATKSWLHRCDDRRLEPRLRIAALGEGPKDVFVLVDGESSMTRRVVVDQRKKIFVDL